MSARRRLTEPRASDKATAGDEGRFAYDGLDRAIHEKARLGILTSLATHHGGLSFNDLKELCSLTDGNLSRHLTVLCDAGLVTVNRRETNRRTQTHYSITAVGRRRFLEYIAVLEQVVSDAVVAQESAGARSKLKHGLTPA